jgi:hypothetical protein
MRRGFAPCGAQRCTDGAKSQITVASSLSDLLRLAVG